MQQSQNDNLYSLDNIRAASKNVEFTKLVAEKLNKFTQLTGYKSSMPVPFHEFYNFSVNIDFRAMARELGVSGYPVDGVGAAICDPSKFAKLFGARYYSDYKKVEDFFNNADLKSIESIKIILCGLGLEDKFIAAAKSPEIKLDEEAKENLSYENKALIEEKAKLQNSYMQATKVLEESLEKEREINKDLETQLCTVKQQHQSLMQAAIKEKNDMEKDFQNKAKVAEDKIRIVEEKVKTIEAEKNEIEIKNKNLEIKNEKTEAKLNAAIEQAKKLHITTQVIIGEKDCLVKQMKEKKESWLKKKEVLKQELEQVKNSVSRLTEQRNIDLEQRNIDLEERFKKLEKSSQSSKKSKPSESSSSSKYSNSKSNISSLTENSIESKDVSELLNNSKFKKLEAKLEARILKRLKQSNQDSDIGDKSSIGHDMSKKNEISIIETKKTGRDKSELLSKTVQPCYKSDKEDSDLSVNESHNILSPLNKTPYLDSYNMSDRDKKSTNQPHNEIDSEAESLGALSQKIEAENLDALGQKSDLDESSSIKKSIIEESKVLPLDEDKTLLNLELKNAATVKNMKQNSKNNIAVISDEHDKVSGDNAKTLATNVEYTFGDNQVDTIDNPNKKVVESSFYVAESIQKVTESSFYVAESIQKFDKSVTDEGIVGVISFGLASQEKINDPALVSDEIKISSLGESFVEIQ